MNKSEGKVNKPEGKVNKPEGKSFLTKSNKIVIKPSQVTLSPRKKQGGKKTSRVMPSNNLVTELLNHRKPITLKGNINSIKNCIEWYNSELTAELIPKMIDEESILIKESKTLIHKIINLAKDDINGDNLNKLWSFIETYLQLIKKYKIIPCKSELFDNKCDLKECSFFHFNDPNITIIEHEDDSFKYVKSLISNFEKSNKTISTCCDYAYKIHTFITSSICNHGLKCTHLKRNENGCFRIHSVHEQLWLLHKWTHEIKPTLINLHPEQFNNDVCEHCSTNDNQFYCLYSNHVNENVVNENDKFDVKRVWKDNEKERTRRQNYNQSNTGRQTGY